PGRREPIRVWFAHPRPADVSELVEWFGTGDVAFGAGENGFSFDARLLDETMAENDPALLQVMDEAAAMLVKQRGQPADVAGKVRAEVRRGLEEGDASIRAVAKALGTSGRTLQRNLTAAGTRFHDLVE